jgi:hypothetical protein
MNLVRSQRELAPLLNDRDTPTEFALTLVSGLDKCFQSGGKSLVSRDCLSLTGGERGGSAGRPAGCGAG